MRGFTLIELSIVLVIIGLIVGGILTGRELINASYIRSTITQVQQYNQAVNTFRGKYGFLPGDIPQGEASKFGFIARGASPGWGDGNGTIQGSTSAGNYAYGGAPITGETAVFWRDLYTAALIKDKLITADFNANFYPLQTDPATRLPPAKLGNGNYFYVYSGDQTGAYQNSTYDQTFFSISVPGNFTTSDWHFNSSPGLKVSEANAIDSKIDDGFPQSGRTQAFYVNHALNAAYYSWSAGGGLEGANTSHLPTTASTAGSATTCYDNASSAGKQQQYSITQNNGAGVNCALFIRFE